MANQLKSTQIKKALLIFLSIAFIFAIGWIGSGLYNSYQYVKQEAKATPSPSPDIHSILASTPDPFAPTPAPTPLLLKTGTHGDEVAHLQSRLKELGFYQGEVDGQFGLGTKEAVIRFQTQHQLTADGLVGPDTMEMIDSSTVQFALPTPSPTQNPLAAENLTIPQENNLPLLINREKPIDENFEVTNLVYLKEAVPEALIQIKGSEIEGNAAAVKALIEMISAAHEDGLSIWQVSAGYRSYDYQKSLFDQKVADYRKEGFSKERAISAAKQTVAEPGTSEHHTGLAFDITVPGETFKYTEQSKWLAQNCWNYGFILRYQEGKEAITGFSAEPWHIRFVGTTHSIPMRDQNVALEEYINQNTSPVTFN